MKKLHYSGTLSPQLLYCKIGLATCWIAGLLFGVFLSFKALSTDLFSGYVMHLNTAEDSIRRTCISFIPFFMASIFAWLGRYRFIFLFLKAALFYISISWLIFLDLSPFVYRFVFLQVYMAVSELLIFTHFSFAQMSISEFILINSGTFLLICAVYS